MSTETSTGLSENAYQEKGIGEIAVQKHSPTNPTSSPFSSIDDLGHDKGNDDANKLVSGIGYQVQQLAFVGNV